jgi:hypothetical protein
MPTDQLYSILTFSNIALGDTATLPHHLVLRDIPVIPDLILLQFPGSFELVSSDATDVTIRNTASSIGDCEALVQAIHPAIRLLGQQPDDGNMDEGLVPRPFCPGSPNGSSAASDSYVVVFRPGGVAGQNVVTTWADAITRLSLLQGTRILEFDDSVVTPIVLPTGVYDMTDVVWSTVPDRIVEVHVPEGTSFTKLRAFRGRIHPTFTGSTPPVADFGLPPPQQDTVTLDDGAEIESTGTGPFFSIDTEDGIGFVLNDNTALIAGAHAVIDVASATSLTIFLGGPNAIININTISGIVGSTLRYVVDDDAYAGASETQTAFLGTLVPLNDTKDLTFPTDVVTGLGAISGTSQVVRVDPTDSGFNLTLPPAFGHRGESITVKNVSSSTNTVHLVAGAGDDIDGAASVSLSGDRFFFKVTSDGVHQWMVTGG